MARGVDAEERYNKYAIRSSRDDADVFDMFNLMHFINTRVVQHVRLIVRVLQCVLEHPLGCQQV